MMCVCVHMSSGEFQGGAGQPLCGSEKPRWKRWAGSVVLEDGTGHPAEYGAYQTSADEYSQGTLGQTRSSSYSSDQRHTGSFYRLLLHRCACVTEPRYSVLIYSGICTGRAIVPEFCRAPWLAQLSGQSFTVTGSTCLFTCDSVNSASPSLHG